MLIPFGMKQKRFQDVSLPSARDFFLGRSPVATASSIPEDLPEDAPDGCGQSQNLLDDLEQTVVDAMIYKEQQKTQTNT